MEIKGTVEFGIEQKQEVDKINDSADDKTK